jgi:hypothetical protein
MGKPRQGAALALKAVAYQKRQTFTNVCCISLCPLIMVALSAGLGNLINTLITRSLTNRDFLYCSNVPAMNAVNIPEYDPDGQFTSSDPSLFPYYTATNGSIQNTNYAVVRSFSNTGPPGAAAFGFQRPCAYWYGDEYPLSSLYERDPNVTDRIKLRDSAFLAQPQGGWVSALGTSNFSARTINIINNNQQRAWYYVGYDSSVSPSLVGSKPKYNVSQAIFNAVGVPLFAPANSTTGLLGTMATRYFVQFFSTGKSVIPGEVNPVPWYQSPPQNSQNSLDDAIADGIQSTLTKIAKLDKTALLGRNFTAVTILQGEIATLLRDIPYGAIYFRKIDRPNAKYAWDYHFGNEKRLQGSTNFPNAGARLLYQQTQLSNAILRSSNGSLASAQITHGLRIMPQLGNLKVDIPFGGIIGSILYPFGVSFLLPIFVVLLVREKEQRILTMMKMNGMGSLAYYFSHYVTMYILYFVSTVIFLLAGTVNKLTFFTLTQPGVLVALFFLWGHNQISLAFFFSTLFSKSRSALGILLLFSFCLSIGSCFGNRISRH